MSGTRKPRNMAEFAELLGITPGAASLALRGSDQVSPERTNAKQAKPSVPQNHFFCCTATKRMTIRLRS